MYLVNVLLLLYLLEESLYEHFLVGITFYSRKLSKWYFRKKIRPNFY